MRGQAGVVLLYVAVPISLLGTLSQHCPMGDAQALKVHALLSVPFYLGALPLLMGARIKAVVMPWLPAIIILLAWQALWGVRLFITTNVGGASPCTLIEGEDYGSASGWWLEQSIAPYYMLVSISALGLIVAAACRDRGQWSFLRRSDNDRC